MVNALKTYLIGFVGGKGGGGDIKMHNIFTSHSHM